MVQSPLFRWKYILHFIWKSRSGVWRKSGEAHNPCCLKSSVKFPQSVMIWAAMSSAGVGPLCFLKSTVNAAIYLDILEHFMLPSADKLYGDADFTFQNHQYIPKAGSMTMVLDWPANLPDLNLIENLWSIVKRKMRDTRPNNADDLKAAIKATWASITPEQCHRLIVSMPRRIDAVIHAKGGPTLVGPGGLVNCLFGLCTTSNGEWRQVGDLKPKLMQRENGIYHWTFFFSQYSQAFESILRTEQGSG